MRFEIFKNILKENFFHNNDPMRGPDEPLRGLNMMSDWTRDEYLSLLKGYQFSPTPSPPAPASSRSHQRRLQDGPFNWVSENVIGAVTSQISDPNGGQCASNYAIATASAWSAAFAIDNGLSSDPSSDSPMIEFSPQ